MSATATATATASKTATPADKKGAKAPTVSETDTPGAEGKPEKRGRQVYDLTTAPAGVVNDKGKLTKVPENYSYKDHKPLQQKQFSDAAAAMEFRSGMLRFRGTRMIEAADKFTAKAANFRQFGDENLRKKAMQLDRMKEKMADLEKQIAAAKAAANATATA